MGGLTSATERNAYGLGLMIGRTHGGDFMGHTGGKPGSTAAVYWHRCGGSPRTVAAFAPLDQPGVVEAEATRQRPD